MDVSTLTERNREWDIGEGAYVCDKCQDDYEEHCYQEHLKEHPIKKVRKVRSDKGKKREKKIDEHDEFIENLKTFLNDSRYQIVKGSYDKYKCKVQIHCEFNCNVYTNTYKNNYDWTECSKCKCKYGCNISQDFIDFYEKHGYGFEWLNCAVGGFFKKK
jgi:hypothetical protein